MTAAPSPAEYRGLPCPCLAVDALSALTIGEGRWRAYGDFDKAIACWSMARWLRRNKPTGWWRDCQLEYRAAIRAWVRYKRAVRAAQERIAA